ncbi:lipocalin-like domain-containing protein [soil metagenome]
MNVMKLLVVCVYLLTCVSVRAAAESSVSYTPAVPGYEFTFPRDHGSHPDFRTEWWYFTGNIQDAEGHPFGYEFTIFRNAAAPVSEASTSPLAATQIYLAHFAISDIGDRQHQAWERIGREGFGQGAASTETLDAHVGAWTMKMDADGTIHLLAKEDDVEINVTLSAEKPYVIHGENGVHQKSEGAGHASHYISNTRMRTDGTITWRGKSHSISGASWMDHEFGSSQLTAEEVGWDWFALQLSTGEEVMVYQMRKKDGSISSVSTGSVIAANGDKTILRQADVEIKTTRRWKSPETGGDYPMGWRVSIQKDSAELTVEPDFDEQEMRMERHTHTSYWEGAVTVTGTWRGEKEKGKGYVELVGYARPFGLL